jgi:hypothetical protein
VRDWGRPVSIVSLKSLDGHAIEMRLTACVGCGSTTRIRSAGHRVGRYTRRGLSDAIHESHESGKDM